MQRHDFAAGHRWENKIPDVTVKVNHESCEPANDIALEAEGFKVQLLKASFTVTKTEPKFI